MSETNVLSVDVFATAPQSSDVPQDLYLDKVAAISRWSEEAGCRGILVYTDNSLVDPWLVSQIVIQSTRMLCPLVAVQPVYMHPYSVAKMAASFTYLYRRRVYLNMVAGGFRNDLLALGDGTPHDLRYERLSEYTTIITQLLKGKAPVTFAGKFYTVEKLSMKPPLPDNLFPGIFISGSSEAGMATARSLGATAIEYPRPGEEYTTAEVAARGDAGIRIGIITDEEKQEAWRIAHERFPGDRKGQITHQISMRVSDSSWHKQLSEMDQAGLGGDLYWLWPFKNYKTFCPYLVGSYEEVSDELAKYIRAGFKNFILDIPSEEKDLRSSAIVFRMADSKARSRVSSSTQIEP